MSDHRVVDHAVWLKARRELLAREKQLTQLRDEISAARRELPWEKVRTNYVFDTAAGEQTLADLFGECTQLLVYHFMFGPDADAGCPGCSWWADNYERNVVFLRQRDIQLYAVARAPLSKLQDYSKRMGWSFPWASTQVAADDNGFNADYHTYFTADELESEVFYNYRNTTMPMQDAPGVSVFAKDGAAVYHTYSTYSRGLDILNAGYNMMDLTPKGRDEQDLPYPSAWLKRHDEF